MKTVNRISTSLKTYPTSLRGLTYMAYMCSKPKNKEQANSYLLLFWGIILFAVHLPPQICLNLYKILRD